MHVGKGRRRVRPKSEAIATTLPATSRHSRRIRQRVLHRTGVHAAQSISELSGLEPHAAENRLGFAARVSLLRSLHAGHASRGRHASRRARATEANRTVWKRLILAVGIFAAAEVGTPLNAFDNGCNILLAAGVPSPISWTPG